MYVTKIWVVKANEDKLNVVELKMLVGWA